MEPLPAVDPVRRATEAPGPGWATLRSYPVGHPAPDEPLAVIAVGPSGADRRALLAGLLGVAPAYLRVPPESFLVLRSAATVGIAVHVPGRAGGASSRPAHRSGASRPPRRVELSGPEPLLRHFLLVDTPETRALGAAGFRVIQDAVRRGGALLFVLPADQSAAPAEVALLTAVAGEAAVFLVGTPAEDGTWPPSPEVEARRAELIDRVPALAGLPWLDLDPAAADTAYLRRALVDWASTEGLRRASRTPPVVPGFGRTVRVAPTAATSDWADRLDRQVRDCTHQLRREIALAVAGIHLRAVQEVVSGAGCPGLPGFLDREVEALSLDVMAACDAELDRVIGESLGLVFGAAPDDGVRLRVIAAVDAAGRDDTGTLHRALLLWPTGEVVPVDGPAAVTALASYPWSTATSVLPPLGVALDGGCYRHWRDPEHADPGQARSWLQRVLRELELELSREVSRRLATFGQSLTNVLAEAIHHGRLRG